MIRHIALGIVFALPCVSVTAKSQSTENPHGEIKNACGSCHTANGWKSISISRTFEHAPRTFPLEGAHARASCGSCHKSLEFAKAPATCASCHQDVHKGELGVTCGSCHTTRSFIDRAGMQRAHELTRFPLRGAHVGADCSSCHTMAPAGRGQFVNTPTQCVSCHLTDYNATTSPNHRGTLFSTACESCHSTTGWRASFDHSKTQFPLTGAHLTQTCTSCHADNVYKGKPTTCVSCHLSNYNATGNPNHASVGYSTNCAACHSTAQWPGATFNHSATAFPLTGSHLAVACVGCHVNGRYTGTPTACVSCHQTDYNNSTNPHHIPAGFPTVCSSCHSTNPGWKPGTYNHGQTSFPLTGAHITATCLDCHADRIYDGKLTTCVSCHLTDYNNTINPRHSSVGFSTDCAACHTTNIWLGARFNHDGQFFPIYSGKHQGKWTSCADCHVNPTNYKAFECILCHQHSNKAEVDNKHSQVSGYQYKSTACYACHPTGD